MWSRLSVVIGARGRAVRGAGELLEDRGPSDGGTRSEVEIEVEVEVEAKGGLSRGGAGDGAIATVVLMVASDVRRSFWKIGRGAANHQA